jgi:hypothetical protein
MTKSSRPGQKKAKYRAFEDEDEPTLLNILLNWLGDIGYTTVRTSNQVYEIFWARQDTEARLEVYKDEIHLYTHKTHLSLTAGIYDRVAFGRLKRFLESYAEVFRSGGNVFPGHYKI